MSAYDVVFIGSSPNALAAAARLASQGQRILVLEPRATVGGPAATDAFAPGFRADSGLFALALDEQVARELDVKVEVLKRASVTALGTSGGAVTLTAWPELPAAFGHAVELLREIARMAPPEVPALSGEAGAGAALSAIAARLVGFGARPMHEVLRLLFLPVRDFVNEQGLSPAAKVILASAALRGLSEGPFAPGTLFTLMQQAAVGDPLFGSTARGGLGALSAALADRARALGAEVRTGVTAIRVDVVDGVAQGVRIGDERIPSGAVVSDLDARTTFTQLVSPAELEPEINRAIKATRYRGTAARVHLALAALPRFTGVDEAALRGTLTTATDVAALERAWDEAKRGQVPTHPSIEFAIPSLLDPSLAPAGRHVLTAWVQHIPRSASREAVSTAVRARLAAYAPDLNDRILHEQVSTPDDLEARFGVTEGHLAGGEIRLDQFFYLRPIPGFASYRTPVERLYLAGSAAHPGGYTGRSGWSFALNRA